MDINCRPVASHTATAGFAGIWTLGAKIYFPRRVERRIQAIRPAAFLHYEV
jgi:hypothetical protein